MARLTDAIRRAIETSDETAYVIARGASVARSQLSRFMRGQAGLSVETAERLAEYLGIRVVIELPRGTRRRRVSGGAAASPRRGPSRKEH